MSETLHSLLHITKTAAKLALNRGVGSQFGEDEVLKKILPAKGVCVDVGAYTDVIAVEGDEKSPTTDFLLTKGYVLYNVLGKTLIFTAHTPVSR